MRRAHRDMTEKLRDKNELRMIFMAQGSLVGRSEASIRVNHRIPHNMPIPSSSSPPQPLTAGSSSCRECTPECCSRPYVVASLNSDKGAPVVVVVVVPALLGVASVEPVVAITVVGKALYQLICLWPTSGMLGPLARPYKDFLRSTEWTGTAYSRLTCSAAPRVLNVTMTSPFSSVSNASTCPPASYQSRTACMLSLPMS